MSSRQWWMNAPVSWVRHCMGSIPPFFQFLISSQRRSVFFKWLDTKFRNLSLIGNSYLKNWWKHGVGSPPPLRDSGLYDWCDSSFKPSQWPFILNEAVITFVWEIIPEVGISWWQILHPRHEDSLYETPKDGTFISILTAYVLMYCLK